MWVKKLSGGDATCAPEEASLCGRLLRNNQLLGSVDGCSWRKLSFGVLKRTCLPPVATVDVGRARGEHGPRMWIAQGIGMDMARSGRRATRA